MGEHPVTIWNTAPCERAVRGRLATFFDWCAQHDDIPGLLTLARAIARWETRSSPRC
jgi:hypothetical protein